MVSLYIHNDKLIIVELKYFIHTVDKFGFSDGRNLRVYLKEFFSSLTWSNKFKMATEITKGLVWLHAEKIIHLDSVKKHIYILLNHFKVIISHLTLLKQYILFNFFFIQYNKKITVHPFGGNDPNNRPDIQGVFERLKQVFFQDINNIDDDQEISLEIKDDTKNNRTLQTSTNNTVEYDLYVPSYIEDNEYNEDDEDM